MNKDKTSNKSNEEEKINKSIDEGGKRTKKDPCHITLHLKNVDQHLTGNPICNITNSFPINPPTNSKPKDTCINCARTSQITEDFSKQNGCHCKNECINCDIDFSKISSYFETIKSNYEIEKLKSRNCDFFYAHQKGCLCDCGINKKKVGSCCFDENFCGVTRKLHEISENVHCFINKCNEQKSDEYLEAESDEDCCRICENLFDLCVEEAQKVPCTICPFQKEFIKNKVIKGIKEKIYCPSDQKKGFRRDNKKNEIKNEFEYKEERKILLIESTAPKMPLAVVAPSVAKTPVPSPQVVAVPQVKPVSANSLPAASKSSGANKTLQFGINKSSQNEHVHRQVASTGSANKKVSIKLDANAQPSASELPVENILSEVNAEPNATAPTDIVPVTTAVLGTTVAPEAIKVVKEPMQPQSTAPVAPSTNQAHSTPKPRPTSIILSVPSEEGNSLGANLQPTTSVPPPMQPLLIAPVAPSVPPPIIKEPMQPLSIAPVAPSVPPPIIKEPMQPLSIAPVAASVPPPIIKEPIQPLLTAPVATSVNQAHRGEVHSTPKPPPAPNILSVPSEEVNRVGTNSEPTRSVPPPIAQIPPVTKPTYPSKKVKDLKSETSISSSESHEITPSAVPGPSGSKKSKKSGRVLFLNPLSKKGTISNAVNKLIKNKKSRKSLTVLESDSVIDWS